MISLIIDNQPIALPDDFSFPLLEENPIYTKSSQYTYDLTISLLKAINARNYHYINRTNIESGIQYNRRAILIVDRLVYLNGTEVILEFGDSDVKIQLLSGNAEFNFIAGGKKKLRDLKLGSAIPFVASDPNATYGEKILDIAKQVFQSLKLTYPDRNWHLLPYHTGIDQFDNRIIGNRYTLHPFDPDGLTPPGGDPSYGDRDAYFWGSYSGQVPQPYLCFIIDEVINALGYTLTYNALAEHPVLRNLYIVHGIQTMEFAKMLPVWTVDEFFSKIELQYDCVFVVDANTKEVELLFKFDTQVNSETVTLNAVGNYTNTPDDENRLDVRISNVGYDLDSDEYYEFMNIDNRINQKATIMEYNTLTEMFNMVQDSSDPDRFKKIFTDKYDQFIAFRTGNTIGGIPEVIPRRVNSFVPLINNLDSTELDHEFDIIPAAMVHSWEFGGDEQSKYYIQFPVAGNADPLFGYDGAGAPIPDFEFDIQSLVEGNISLSEEDTSYTKMRLAVYQGLSALDLTEPNADKARYPIAFVESLAEYFEETKIIRYFGPIGGDPFRLKNINREIYQEAIAIDTSKTYKCAFEHEANIDVRSKFIINNRRFVCYKIEREVTPLGFAPLAIGYFYPYTTKKED